MNTVECVCGTVLTVEHGEVVACWNCGRIIDENGDEIDPNEFILPEWNEDEESIDW